MGKPVITVLVGLPGSGKTTWALKEVKSSEDSNTVRVNRDDLRKMTTGEFWTWDPEKFEPLITEMETAAVRAGVLAGFNVIIDATHLRNKARKLWKKRADEWGADLRVVTLNTDVEECIRRDQARFEANGERLVGREVIERMATSLEI